VVLSEGGDEVPPSLDDTGENDHLGDENGAEPPLFDGVMVRVPLAILFPYLLGRSFSRQLSRRTHDVW
jgi:hypothetical protein